MKLSVIPSRNPGSDGARVRWWPLVGLVVAVAGCREEANGRHKIAPGDQLSYEYMLSQGQYLHASARSANVDLKLMLWGPGDHEKPLLTSDGSELRGRLATEEVAWLAQAPGRYRLQIEVSDPGDEKPGSFTLEVVGPRPPSDRDRLLAEAISISIAGDHQMTEAEHKNHEAWLMREKILEPGPDLWRRLGVPRREADILYFRAEAREELTKRDRAEAEFFQAGALYRENGYWAAAAQSLNRANLLRDQGGRHKEAAQGFQNALQLARKAGDSATEGKILANLGNAYIDLKNVGSALDNLKEAERIQESQHSPNLARTLVALGDAYEALNDTEDSREAYEQALELAKKAHDPEILAPAYNNLGAYFQSFGEWNQAIENLQGALDALKEMSSPAWRARTLNNLGRIYFRMGRSEEAQKAFLQALDELAKIAGTEARDHEAEAAVFTNLAFLYLRDKQLKPARELIARARSSTGQNDQLEVAILEVEGATYRELQEYKKARHALDRSLVLSKKLANTRTQASVLLGLAQLDRAQGTLHSALSRIEQALGIIESSRRQVLDKDLRATLSASTRDFYDFYIDLLVQLQWVEPRAGYGQRAFEISERAHARSLLEALGEVALDLQDGGDPALIKERTLLLGQLQGADLHLSTLRQQRARTADVHAAEADLKVTLVKLSRFEDKLRRSNRKYADLTQPKPLNAREIVHKVAEGGALVLEYWLGEERSYLWVASSQGVATFIIPESRKTIERQASSFYSALLAPGDPQAASKARLTRATELQTTGVWLAKTLLSPIRDILGDHPLLIVADGSLHYIPFSALPDPADDDNPGPLLQKHQVVDLPSASVLEMLRREKASSPPMAAAIVADPVFQRDDPRVLEGFRGRTQLAPTPGELRSGTVSAYIRLRHTRVEAEAIARLLGERNCQIFKDFAASVAKITTTDLSQFRVVHFATHGDINSAIPELSALVLSMVDEQGRAQKGYLRLHDIYNLKLRADLVVLSACKTALGREIGGEGLVGLTRGFMYAGAKRVLASLWSVDSAATEKLMEKFYGGMTRDHFSPAQALRAAQIEMSKDPTWSDPYYWAGFTLQGEWR